MVRSFSLAFFLLFVSAPSFAANAGPFTEQKGIVVVEVESTPTVGNWVSETIWPDYTGTAYYRWNGANQLTNPGVARLKYDIAIEHAGDYRLALRNRHEDPDPGQENDCWVKMDSGPWIKAFSNNGPGTVGQWNWETKFEITHGTEILPIYTLSPGLHTFEISGRSKHFQIDRFHLFLDTVPNPLNKNKAESPIYTGQTNIANYCTSKTTSGGCIPVMASSGVPQVGGTFNVSANQLIPNKSAMMIYGFTPQAAVFQGGYLCIAPQIKRLPVQITPAGPACTGTISINFATVADGNLGAGVTTYVQTWFRDGQDPFGSGLTDGLQFTWIL